MRLSGLTAESDQRDHAVIVLALALHLAIVLLDVLTPLGYAEWVLHLFPLSLAALQRKPWAPALLCIAGILGAAVGLWLSPPLVNYQLTVINRALGAVSFVITAAVLTQAIVNRNRMMRQLRWRALEGLLGQRLGGNPTVNEVAAVSLDTVCEWSGADAGVLYGRDGARLVQLAGHALGAGSAPQQLAEGEGVAGQVARDGRPRLITPAGEAGPTVVGAQAQWRPRQALVLPLRADGRCVGVLELSMLQPRLDALQLDELSQGASEAIGSALESARLRMERQELLEETQRQAEELQAQQEELRVANEELAEQARALQQSQRSLEGQQRELEQANTQLEVHTQTLEQQQRRLLQHQAQLEDNARDLAQASRYKSEFLANMSHELRTPLNSSLILSRLLLDNKPRNLNDEQLRYARAVHDANADLLMLINDVLDLSKVEAGHADFRSEEVAVAELLQRLRTQFEPQAQAKGLRLRVETLPGTPDQLHSDAHRVSQVLKNLLSNALKFTAEGEVSLRAAPGEAGGVRFEVRDTGLGIPRDKHEVIFEAFRQADGSTSRRYGGTGLGLSISRELVQRMGGRIALDSAPGQGSCFTLWLPAQLPESALAPPVDAVAAAMPAAPVLTAGPALPAPRPPDDDCAAGARRVLLAVEDDPAFAEVLRELVQDMGYDCVLAHSAAHALAMARELLPLGVLLDIGLPDVSGLSVLESLKRDPRTRHVPVHIVSAAERSTTALELGALGHLVKPVAREDLQEAVRAMIARHAQQPRRVLLVEDDPSLQAQLTRLLAAPGVEIVPVGTVALALERLSALSFDCMVTDLSLPDGTGFDLLERMAATQDGAFPPVIVYTGRVLSRDEEQRLRRHSRSIIIKGARSPERLVDEVTLFLHSVESALPGDQRRLLDSARERDSVLQGRRVLLAEDDVRNVFALTAILEPLGVSLEVARNGREAVDKLRAQPGVDLVLMDVMMPEMDGLTAMREIRRFADDRELPIIALTAKAMADDRLQCLEAGANDYLSKPIDVDRLVSLCRVWVRK